MVRHAFEQQEILYQLGVWQFMNQDEIDALYDAKSDYEVDKLARKYRDKYWDDIQCDDVDDDVEIDYDDDIEIINTSLSKGTQNTLMRNHIKTISQFISFVEQNGWEKIKTFGVKRAYEVFQYMYPDEDYEEIMRYVNNYKTGQLINKTK